MADEARKIRTVNETESSFETTGSSGLRCVASDTGNWLYVSQDGTKLYKVARQSYKTSGVTTYLDNDFNDVTIRGDCLVAEYIKMFNDTNNSIRFQNDQIDLSAGGVIGISNRDDEVQINPFGVSGFTALVYADNSDTDAKLIVEQNSSGDATIAQKINGGTSWYFGPDNSDSDTWKLGTAGGFSSNVALKVITNQNIETGGRLSVSGGLGDSRTMFAINNLTDGTTRPIRIMNDNSNAIMEMYTNVAGDPFLFMGDNAGNMISYQGYLGYNFFRKGTIITDAYLTDTPASDFEVMGSINQEKRVYHFTEEYSVDELDGVKDNAAVMTFRLPSTTEYFTIEITATNVANSETVSQKEMISGKLVSNSYTEYDAETIFNSTASWSFAVTAAGSNNDLKIWSVNNDVVNAATGMAQIKIFLHSADPISYQGLTYDIYGV